MKAGKRGVLGESIPSDTHFLDLYREDRVPPVETDQREGRPHQRRGGC